MIYIGITLFSWLWVLLLLLIIKTGLKPTVQPSSQNLEFNPKTIIPQVKKETNTLLLALLKPVLLLSAPKIICDFANTYYRDMWLREFNKGSYWIATYLDKATEANFAMKGKECIEFWKSMIKVTKPASPTAPRYYDHITIRPMVHNKPHYSYYGGNGYGVLPYHHNGYDKWLRKHYKKYPNGKLPEQAITITKIKA